MGVTASFRLVYDRSVSASMSPYRILAGTISRSAGSTTSLMRNTYVVLNSFATRLWVRPLS